MTGQPQQGYIITEDRLVKLQGYFHEQNMEKFFEVINEIFDHPYQSEREKVLTMCANERKKLTFDSSFATDNAYNEGRLSIIKIIEEELRQAGEP
jgi:hypothetical protein